MPLDSRPIPGRPRIPGYPLGWRTALGLYPSQALRPPSGAFLQSREFLEEEQQSMPAAWFAAEYMCEFTEAIDSVFSYEQVMAAVAEEVEPLDFGGDE